MKILAPFLTSAQLTNHKIEVGVNVRLSVLEVSGNDQTQPSLIQRWKGERFFETVQLYEYF